jgi:hypothetical protein
MERVDMERKEKQNKTRRGATTDDEGDDGDGGDEIYVHKGRKNAKQAAEWLPVDLT